MIDMLLNLFAQYGYAIVFVSIFLDNAGLPIPGELLLLLFGALARNGDGSAPVGLLLASVGAVAGDSVGYWLGRLGGEGVLRTYCRLTLGSGKCVRRAASYYQLHGRTTVVFGRFVLGVRAFLPSLAGSAGMPFGQFLLFDALGAFVWAGVFIALGYGIGWSPERVHEGYRGVSVALLATVVAGLAVYLAVKLVRRWRHGAASLRARTIARVEGILQPQPRTPKGVSTMRPDLGRTILGGFAGTVVMTVMMYFVAPMMLGRPMDVAASLGAMLGGSWALGMLTHLLDGGIIFPLIFAYVLYRALPGEPWLKGTVWGLMLWFLSQAVVTPMMGGGMFSANAGGVMAVMASLVAHVVYGALLGGIAGLGGASVPAPQPYSVR